MIAIILLIPGGLDNGGVRSVLRLTQFEEFELWLQSLRSYCSRAGRPLNGADSTVSDNCRPPLLAVVEVMGDLIERCPKVLEPELGKVGPSALFTRIPDEDASPQAEQFAGLRRLWEFLRQYQVVGAGLARHASLPLPEYRAYGLVLGERIDVYCRTEAHQQLTRKYLFFKYRHMIERDLVSSIEFDGVREELGQIFFEFLRLLAYLEYFQNSIQHSFKYQRLFLLLHYFHQLYQSILKSLEQSHQYVGYSLPHLNQEVTSVRFAMKIEVKRIFRDELRDVESLRKLGEIYSRIETALGVLSHITQQSFVGLVRQLNPKFDERTLFDNIRDQQAEAARLIADLNQLYKLALDAGRERSNGTYQQVLTAIDRFQAASMRLLFFKDWEPVEQFAAELLEATGDQRAFVLHRLEVFLSALIGEVSKQREVLGAANRAVGS